MTLAELRHRVMAALSGLRLRAGLVDRTQDVVVSGETASFRVETFPELHRTESLAGERDVLERFLEDVRPDDVVLDVGAAVGTYSCFAAEIASMVVSIEPHPANAERLEENLELNGASADVREVALSTGSGLVGFEHDGDVGSGTHRVSEDGEHSVRQVRGDDLDVDADVAKVDVEGHEREALEGLRETLESVRVVYVETHPQHGVDVRDVRERLEESGLSVEVLESSGRSETFVRGSRGESA